MSHLHNFASSVCFSINKLLFQFYPLSSLFSCCLSPLLVVVLFLVDSSLKWLWVKLFACTTAMLTNNQPKWKPPLLTLSLLQIPFPLLSPPRLIPTQPLVLSWNQQINRIFVLWKDLVNQSTRSTTGFPAPCQNAFQWSQIKWCNSCRISLRRTQLSESYFSLLIRKSMKFQFQQYALVERHYFDCERIDCVSVISHRWRRSCLGHAFSSLIQVLNNRKPSDRYSMKFEIFWSCSRSSNWAINWTKSV